MMCERIGRTHLMVCFDFSICVVFSAFSVRTGAKRSENATTYDGCQDTFERPNPTLVYPPLPLHPSPFRLTSLVSLRNLVALDVTVEIDSGAGPDLEFNEQRQPLLPSMNDE